MIVVVCLAIKGVVVVKVDLGRLFEVMFCNKSEYVSICNSITQSVKLERLFEGEEEDVSIDTKYQLCFHEKMKHNNITLQKTPLKSQEIEIDQVQKKCVNDILLDMYFGKCCICYLFSITIIYSNSKGKMYVHHIFMLA